MIDHRVAVEHVRRQRKMILLTLGLLFVAFFESYYLSCGQGYSPLWCAMSWIYVVLAVAVLFAVWWYRK